MDILLAFVFGGLLCVAAQILLRIKPNPTVVMTIAICLGGLLGALGVMATLTASGGSGVGVMILSCGEALVGTFIGALHGEPFGLISLTLLLIFSCIVLGLLGGIVQHVRDKKKISEESSMPADSNSKENL